MTSPAFPIADRRTIKIVGSGDVFPVNRIFCVGRNYAAHAREMGANPDREPPFFFGKPSDSLITGSECVLPYPPRTSDLHHEVELVVGLKADAFNVTVSDALDLVFGAALGLDFTRRDLQGAAKKAGKPWDTGKGFDGSAVIGDMVAFDASSLPQKGRISLSVNGEGRQSGDLSDMIWSVAEVISELSTYQCLKAGDLIFTGTPEGVGPVATGDKLIASADGLPDLSVTIVK